jgi:lipoyl(octanoyl) transferase
MTSITAQSITCGTLPFNLRVRDLGRMAYGPALELQRQVQQEVIAARETDGRMELLLVEHDPPVITVSRRPGARTHLIATEAMLSKAGVEVAETDRGGDITYHGPGQLVAYPIIDLNRFGFRINTYMRFLEQVVIDTLREFGVEGKRDESATGVWVKPGASRAIDVHALHCVGVGETNSILASKICALGVRVSRWVSMHGLALNVTTDLDHFNLIVPCGLAGRGVTSLQRELGERCPSMDDVKCVMIDRFQCNLLIAGADAAAR